MGTRAAALLLGLLCLACEARDPALPVLGQHRVKIGTPPLLLLEQLAPVPEGNAARQERLRELFAEAGCDRLEGRWPTDSELPQVHCTLAGESATQILVSASFDEPERSAQHDNWAGAAMLPSLYRSVRVVPRHHSYVFVGFAGEDSRHPGHPAASARMVERLPDEDRRAIAALVSLHGLAIDVAGVWETEADPDLHQDLFSVSRSLDLPMRRVDFHFVRKTSAPTGLSTTVGTLEAPRLVRDRVRLPPLDVPSIVIGLADAQVGEYLDSFRLVAAYLSYLDQTLEIRRQLREEQDGAERPTSG